MSLLAGSKDFWENVYYSFDTNNDGNIDMREYMCFQTLLAQGMPILCWQTWIIASNNHKLRKTFHIYDFDNDKSISQKEFAQIVRTLEKLVTPTASWKATELISKMDKNGDRKISEPEFLEGN